MSPNMMDPGTGLARSDVFYEGAKGVEMLGQDGSMRERGRLSSRERRLKVWAGHHTDACL